MNTYHRGTETQRFYDLFSSVPLCLCGGFLLCKSEILNFKTKV
jgi:hypothetical protein